MPRDNRPRLRFCLGALCLALPLLATGCADTDPDRREGMWQPEGVATGNLAAMVADPMDLVRGHGDAGPDGGHAAAVIQKWTKAGPGAPTPLASDTTTGGH